MWRRVALVVAAVALLSGCVAAPQPVPSRSSTPSSPITAEPEPEARPLLPLRGDCSALLTDAQLSAVTGTPHTAAVMDRKGVWIAASIAATSCGWNDPGGARSVWIVIVPNATIPAEDSMRCTASTDCFFTRVINEYRIDGYISLPTATPAMVDEIVALVSTRLTEPPTAPWEPDGAWPSEFSFSDLAPLDVSALIDEASGPMGGEPGGYQPDSISTALAAGRYELYYWESPDGGAWIGLELVTGGGWLLDSVAGRTAIDVAGAAAAAWVPADYPAGAAATPGASPLLVTDGVNLLRIETVGDPDAVIAFAADTLALLGAR